MQDPWMEVEYEVGPCTPPEVRVELERRLGARDGDTVILFSDGSVALGRQASTEDARALLPHLTRLQPSSVHACDPPSLSRPAPPSRRGHAHLRIVSD